MLKLRHGFVVAIVALLSGCPEAADDGRIPRLLKGDVSVEAGFEQDEYVCTNVRRWREKGEDGKNLDMPDYLTEPAPDIDGKNDEENRREAHRKEYLKYHEGILTICRTPLVKDAGANRGTCPVCTAMLNDPKYMDAQHTSSQEAPAPDPIKLDASQIFRTKVEYRLKAAKDDYVTDAGDQEKSFRDWLGSRNAPAADQLEKLVAQERGKGVWSDPKAATPRTTTIVKYGLPPLAEPLIRCPNCKKALNPVEPRCWNCSHYYTATARDEHNSIAEPQELLCPWCKAAVDPTTNYCRNKNCEKFHRAVDRDGPCWRCGGSHVCPECNGSGKNQSAPVYNSTGALVTGLDTCFYCGTGTLGVCPECDTHGFAMYEGSLPPNWRADRRKADDWRIQPAGAKSAGSERAPPAAPPAGGGDDGDKKDTPEKDK